MFSYDDAILQRYPTIRAGLLHATGLVNAASPTSLLTDYRAEQQAAAAELHDTAVTELPSIAAWRRAFRRFGADPTQHRSAPEALLRWIAKRGEIPTISALVDIGNLVSIRHAVPVAVFDLAKVTGTINVRFATGDEVFTGIGIAEPVHPETGEVIFVDSDDHVLARRWCWRQSASGATDATTTTAVFVIEAHHDMAGDDIAAALTDLEALLASHQPHSRSERHAPFPSGSM
ncbi:MAG: hypothetical protein H0V19_07430 [Euzebyales bacterium]|nr:hypothetical protein [Euzebyales bacterium]MBA3621418.1 hypothetical protein [Euzebyales bacterium]